MLAFRPLLITLFACVGVFTLSRLGIVVWQYGRVAAAGSEHLPFIFAQGLRFDLLTIGVLLGIPALLTPLFIINRRLTDIWLPVLRAYCVLVIGLTVYIEVATPSFINEFDAKPDRRFIEYLIYPKEVFSMLWAAYKLQLFIAATVVTGSMYVLHRVLGSAKPATAPLPLWSPLLLIPLVGLLLLAAIRSTTDHRPVNPSSVVFATDALANQLPLNSSYTTLYAIY